MAKDESLHSDGPVDVTVGQDDPREGRPFTGQFKLPETIAILPVKDMSMFPRMVLPMLVGEKRHMALIDDVVSGDKLVGLVALKDETQAEDVASTMHLHEIGVAALVLKMARAEKEGVRLIAQGLTRFRVLAILQSEPYIKALVRAEEDLKSDDMETMALINNLRAQFRRILELAPHLPEELNTLVASVDDGGALCDMVASAMNLSPEERQSVVEALDVKVRLQRVTYLMNREIQMLELGSKIQKQVKDGLEKTQKDYYLRQQMKAIQKELGEEGEPQGDDIAEMRQKLKAKDLPEQVRTEAERELNRMAKMHASSSEYHVINTYLDWIVALPWNEARPRTTSGHQARRPGPSWTRTTTTWTRSRSASWSTWRCASSTPR